MDAWPQVAVARAAVSAVFGLVLGLVALWAGCFKMVGTFAFLACWSLSFGLLAFTRTAWSWVPVVVIPLLGMPFASVPPAEFMLSQSDMLDRVQREGPSAISEPELLAIAWLHRAMVMGARVAGLKEVATEAATLHLADDDQERTYDSDFAMRSPKVRAAVRDLLASGDGGSVTGERLAPVRVTWDRYGEPGESLRVALALNCPMELMGTLWARDGRRWAKLKARCYVAYPSRAEVPLGRLNGVRLALDEGLFHLLQERGWLRPYLATYRWEMSADDPRLLDPTTVHRDPAEQRLLLLASRIGM